MNDYSKGLPRDPRLSFRACMGGCGIVVAQGTLCQACVASRPLPVRTLARRATSDRAVVALAVGALVVVATLALWPATPKQVAVDTETIDAQPYTAPDVVATKGRARR